jgi:nitroreductase
MSRILDHIVQRRSIRKYTDEPVSAEDIHTLLQSAMAAPSASNRQPWEFIVVTEEQVLKKLRSGLVFGRYRSPLVIVVCGNMRRAWPGPARDFWIQDCSAAAENILLAATGLGLGTVWIGVHPIKPLERIVSTILSLPEHIIPLCAIHVGHPTKAKRPRTQYNPRKVWWQGYGNRSAEKPTEE